ncbi:hypothetical protein NG791_25630 [Laspinema sp. D1]|uniref:hypothetical protein n=1 Tax=Laspinema palackyanum TaxID=3231601 RepID=UPI003492959D|nr:hypothetical protein [Laspinema sp. D2b]
MALDLRRSVNQHRTEAEKMAPWFEAIGQLLPTDRRTERPPPMPSNPKAVVLPMKKMAHSFGAGDRV